MLTIDLGTSGPKVAVFTLHGRYVDGEFEPVELAALARRRRRAGPDRLVGRASSLHRPTAASGARVPDERSRRSRSPRSGRARWRSTSRATRCTNAVIWMDSAGRRRHPSPRRWPGAGPGLRPTQAAPLDLALPAGSRRCRARIPSRTSLAAGRAARPGAGRTWKYLEPKDWLNLKLTGRVRRDLRLDRAALGHRQPRSVQRPLRPGPLLGLAGLARELVARPGAGHLDRRAAGPDRPRRSSGLPAGIPVVGGTPDVQSAAASAPARSRDFEGHLYLGTSSWLTCHVPFKKTDVLHGVASLPSPLPGRYFVADEQEVAGGAPQLAARPRAVRRRPLGSATRRPTTSSRASTHWPTRARPGRTA